MPNLHTHTMTPASPFRIAIIGGGIGGLCAALSIHYQCKHLSNIQIDVYEQASQYSEIGAGVAVGVNAAKLLHHIGLGERLNDIAGRRDGVWISFRRYDDGAEIVTIPANDSQKVRQLPVHRAELLEVLYNAVQERQAANLHTNKPCVGFTQNDDAVQVQFRDESSAAANLVIACDGIHSVIRSQVATDKPRYSGRIAYRGLVPIDKIEEYWPFKSYSASWLGKDKHLLAFPISQNKTLNIVAFVSTPEDQLGGLRESWSSKGDRKDLAKDFRDFTETVRKIIDAMPDDPSKWTLNDRNPLEQWVHGRVVLMGDAAHAMLPHQGAGAGQAIEDGWILGRALADYLKPDSSEPSLHNWMNLYQSIRLPRAQKAQQTAREAGDVYEMQTPDMKGLSYDDCLPLVAEKLKNRMKWIWTEDIDEAYEKAREEHLLR